LQSGEPPLPAGDWHASEPDASLKRRILAVA
jgi:hypothetical protein